MTMAFARQVMDMELDPESRNFAKVLGVKQQIASSILTATARIRDGLLRPSNDDGIAELLETVNRRSVRPEDVLN